MPSIIYDEKALMSALLEAGVHFGHQTKRWNPKMKPFIFMKRNGIYIVDLRFTMEKLKEAFHAMKEVVSKDGMVLFVGTKKQAQTSVFEEASRCGMPYVTKRWLGGTLTNYQTIKRSIDKMKRMEKKLETERETLPKKEALEIEREITKMKSFYEGLRDMKKIPDAMWVVDVKREINAIYEARALGVKVFGIADTNCDPDLLDYIVPGNDDAIRSVKLLTSVMADAVIEGSTYAAKQDVEKEAEALAEGAPADTSAIEAAEEIAEDLAKKVEE